MKFKLLNYQLQVNRTVNRFFLPVLTTYPTCRSWRMQQQAQKRATVRAPRLLSRMGTLSRVSGTAYLTRSASNGLLFLISLVTVILFMLLFLEILDSVICGLFVCTDMYDYIDTAVDRYTFTLANKVKNCNIVYCKYICSTQEVNTLQLLSYVTLLSPFFRPLSRSEKSLGLLTSKFVELLKSSPEGILDLNVVR